MGISTFVFQTTFDFKSPYSMQSCMELLEGMKHDKNIRGWHFDVDSLEINCISNEVASFKNSPANKWKNPVVVTGKFKVISESCTQVVGNVRVVKFIWQVILIPLIVVPSVILAEYHKFDTFSNLFAFSALAAIVCVIVYLVLLYYVRQIVLDLFHDTLSQADW